jgi:hypothetical protein
VYVRLFENDKLTTHYHSAILFGNSIAMVEKHCGHLIPSDDEINVGVTRKNGEEPPPLPSEEPHLALNWSHHATRPEEAEMLKVTAA